MEQLKQEKGQAMAVIAYHTNTNDIFTDNVNAFHERYQYYRPGSGVPLSIIDGRRQFLGGIANGNMYSSFLPAYNEAASLSPSVEIALIMEAPDRVRVELTNTSWSALQGTLQIALVERHRPYAWGGDMNIVDFICRTMMPGPNGQTVMLAPSQKFVSTQPFNLQRDWNYCSIVAFFQAGDKKILQGAMIDIEETIPAIQLENAPRTGDLLIKGSENTFSWTSNRNLTASPDQIVYEYSADGGTTWYEFSPTSAGGNSYRWKAPDINSGRCLLSVRDRFGGARAFSGLFGIGVKGDLNADGAVNDTDRSILIRHLTENKAAVLSGADLDGNGAVDLFDLIYFDATFK